MAVVIVSHRLLQWMVSRNLFLSFHSFIILISSILDLGPPLVTVMSDGNSTAGEVLSLICEVVTVEGVRSKDITIMWSGTNGTIQTGGHLMIEDHSTTGTVTTGRLVFSPLHTSDRGQYTCTSRISVTSVGVDVSNTSSVDITVSSKSLG